MCLFNHFLLSKAIIPLGRSGLLGLKENEFRRCLTLLVVWDPVFQCNTAISPDFVHIGINVNDLTKYIENILGK